jgi:MSHA pilin protein MshC
MVSPRSRHQLGFTLVELVLVLVVASIVAISASSRFFRADDANLFSASDKTLALLRQVQLTSMQDTVNLATRCPTLVFSAAVIGVATNSPCTAAASLVVDAANPEQTVLNDIQLQVLQQSTALTLPVLIRFDSWGRPQGACANGCTIALNHSAGQRQICLSSQGYAALC